MGAIDDVGRERFPTVFDGLFSTWVRRTREPGVYELSWNLLVLLRGLFYGGRAGCDKRKLVDALARRYPNVVVWIGDWTSDEEARRLLGVPLEPETGKSEYVLVTDRSRLLALLPHLDEGGWGMIFLAYAPVSKRVVPDEGLPRGPAEFKAFVHSLGGRSAIASWFDDVSWTVLAD